jgi:hypothetical protein
LAGLVPYVSNSSSFNFKNTPVNQINPGEFFWNQEDKKLWLGYQDASNNLGVELIYPQPVTGGSGTDVFVTGGTYSNGDILFTNNTGGTFNVVGLFTGSTDVFVTGGTYSAGTATFSNNTGGTFSVTGFSDGDISSYVTKNSLTGVTNWQSLTLFNGGASTVAIANNVIRVYPIILWEDITIDEIQIRITAGNGVGSLLIGIWKWENGLGTDLVYTSPVFNTNVTGLQSFTSQNQFLPRGTYIIGYNTNLNGASIVSQTGFANIFGEQSSGGGAFQLQVNHTYTGTLPTPFPTTAVANTFLPIRVQFKLI